MPGTSTLRCTTEGLGRFHMLHAVVAARPKERTSEADLRFAPCTCAAFSKPPHGKTHLQRSRADHGAIEQDAQHVQQRPPACFDLRGRGIPGRQPWSLRRHSATLCGAFECCGGSVSVLVEKSKTKLLGVFCLDIFQGVQQNVHGAWPAHNEALGLAKSVVMSQSPDQSKVQSPFQAHPRNSRIPLHHLCSFYPQPCTRSHQEQSRTSRSAQAGCQWHGVHRSARGLRSLRRSMALVKTGAGPFGSVRIDCP